MDKKTGMEIYVDPINGNDDNEGTHESPFKTLERVKKQVKDQEPTMQGDIVVYLREGIYKPVSKTRNIALFNLLEDKKNTYPLRVSSLIFDESDSGRGEYKVIYKSYPGERAVISGGREVSGWEMYDEEHKIYRVFVGCDTETRQLYVNGRRAVRARSMEGLNGNTEYNPECHKDGGPAYITDDKSILTWKNIRDVEFVYPRSFTMSRCGVDRVEKEGERVKIYMKQPGWYYVTHKYGTSAQYPVWIENAYELLDTPGEWYLDRSEGYIYYIPLPGESMADISAVIPEIDVLLSIKGKCRESKVRNIEFHDINFEYAGWLRPNYANCHCDSQNNYIRESYGQEFDSDHQSDAAIEIEFAENIVLEDCRFSKMGITAIRMTNACWNNRIQGCEIHDCSGGGISMGDPEFRNPESRQNYLPEHMEDMMWNNRILHNYIHDIAVEFMSATAISASFTRNTEIRNNEICRVPYSGLHIGYGWDVLDTSCTQGMKICGNVVDTFMTKLYDGGGMYFIGATGGTRENPNRIECNFIRNQVEPKYGGFYFDEGSSCWQAEHNVFENTELWCNISGISKKLHDVTVTNTWLTNGYSYYNPSLGQKGLVIEEPRVYPRRNWPEEVEEIIGSAGLTSVYSHLRPDYHQLGEVWFDADCIVLQAGMIVKPEATARTVRGVRIEELPQVALRFSSDNPEIAAVDGEGKISGVSFGKCVITATVTLNSVEKSAQVEVYVEDAMVHAEVIAKTNIMLPGTTQKIEALCSTELGRKYKEQKVLLESTNPAVVQVDASGTAKAVACGSAEIIARVQGRSREISSGFTMQVCSEAGGNLIQDAVFWNTSLDVEVSNGPGWIQVSSQGGLGTAIYGGRVYGDEWLEFDLLLEANDNELVCLYLRSRKESGRSFDAGNAGYVVVISPKGIELHRFHDRKRTMIYGNVYPFVPLAGEAVLNEYIKSGEACHAMLGAINTEKGVRLRMSVDNRTVFDYVDGTPEKIEEPGYFGVTVTRGSIRLSSGMK